MIRGWFRAVVLKGSRYIKYRFQGNGHEFASRLAEKQYRADLERLER